MRMNTVFFTGTVRAVERKTTSKGGEMLILHLEASEERTFRGDKKVVRTELDVTCLGDVREYAKGLEAGDVVFLEGALETQFWNWQDRECSKLTVRPVSLVRIEQAQSAPRSTSTPQAQYNQPAPRQSAPAPSQQQNLPEDDIPF